MTLSMPRASLLTYLLALTLCAVIPVLCFAAYLTIGLARTEQAAVERGLVETANAVASGVERELTNTITTLEALATSQSLDRADYGAFAHEAQRVLESQARYGWLSIHLASPDGAPLMNSSGPGGGPLPLPDIVTVKQTAASGKPTVSDLLPSRVYDQLAFALRVPVVRNGAITCV